MFILDYKIDDRSKNTDSVKDYNLRELSLADLHYSDLFCGDLIIKTDTASLSAEWRWIPILHVAPALNDIAQSLKKNLTNEYEFTENAEKLIFELDGEMVRITSTYSPGGVKVELSEFQATTKAMLNKALNDFYLLWPEAEYSPAILALKEYL